MTKVDWFSRGRDAMTEGRPCFINDARISGQSRQSWYAGWNHQARLNNSKNSTAAEIDEALAAIQQIIESLKSLP